MKRAILFSIYLFAVYFTGNSQAVSNYTGEVSFEMMRQIQSQYEGSLLSGQTIRMPVQGIDNCLNLIQTGNNNFLFAVQEGMHNVFEAEQGGVNNYLVTIQKGLNNSITGYRQQNYSENLLCDDLIQVGINLNFSAEGLDGARLNGNSVSQIGSNLSFRINRMLPSFGNGIKVSQTGRDMRVVVEQSYYSFPSK